MTGWIHGGVEGFESGDGVEGELEIGLTGLVSSGSSRLPQRLRRRGSETVRRI